MGSPKPEAKGPPAVAPPAQAGEYAGGDQCLACHDIEEAFKKNPHYKSWADESLPWSERGCETCHGPGQAHIDGGGDTTQIFRFTQASAAEISDQCLDCHLKQTEAMSNFLRNEHGLNSVACTECHSVHKSHTAQFLLKARQPALCYDCHNEVRGQFNRPFHHKVNEGLIKCTDCHDQHGGYTSFTSGLVANIRQMRGSTGNWEACFECHADKQGPFVFEHQPVRIDGCGSCHFPHGSSNPRLLIRSEVRALCLECHTAVGGDPGPEAPSFHDQRRPWYQNCTTCHLDIHGSNQSPVFFVD
ncbi:MAG TPA: DmsE family decaheme c-type cytochrome [Candidatus Acidoferrales bacterium]|nr:DmsE family decaheme c-type cytochrome [Candidatus Acidoferrales bacterium]